MLRYTADDTAAEYGCAGFAFAYLEYDVQFVSTSATPWLACGLHLVNAASE